nr:hypothetical protein CFP56_19237 [Quercus suber]
MPSRLSELPYFRPRNIPTCLKNVLPSDLWPVVTNPHSSMSESFDMNCIDFWELFWIRSRVMGRSEDDSTKKWREGLDDGRARRMVREHDCTLYPGYPDG